MAEIGYMNESRFDVKCSMLTTRKKAIGIRRAASGLTRDKTRMMFVQTTTASRL